jgi:DNA-binding transcriptional ArsR family regulator
MAAAVEADEKKRLKNALATAVGHPLRTKCLAILGERVASPTQISRYLGIEVSKVGYHVTALAKANLIEEVGNRPVRGTTEHFYKAVDLPLLTDEQEAELGAHERRTFAESIVSLFAGNTIHALDVGTLIARTDHHLTRVAFNVDQEGWNEMTAAHMELYKRVEEIRATAATRMGSAEDDDERIPILSFQAMFELPPMTEFSSNP